MMLQITHKIIVRITASACSAIRKSGIQGHLESEGPLSCKVARVIVMLPHPCCPVSYYVTLALGVTGCWY